MKSEISVESYLQEVKIPLRLSCLTESGWPAILSLWYLYEEGAIYCATPEHARVVTYLRAQSRCAFEIAADQPPYCGLRGRAVAEIDEERGIDILKSLLLRYTGGIDNPLARRLLGRTAPEVAIRLTPQKIVTWNFSERMAELPGQRMKVCPG